MKENNESPFHYTIDKSVHSPILACLKEATPMQQMWLKFKKI